MIECNWTPVYTLATQTSWTSGIYLALLTNAQGYQNYIMFVVRDDSRVAPLLYQQPVTTYQAYNNYPFDNRTGKSLYAFNSYGANDGTWRQERGEGLVRPAVPGRRYRRRLGPILLFVGDTPSSAGWRNRGMTSRTRPTSTHTRTAARLLNYRGILSVGHDEYWSKPMYDAFVAARDAGVNLALLRRQRDLLAGAVRVFEQRCSEPRAGLLQECQPSIRSPDPTLKTVNWRDPLLNRPEQTLIGVQFTNQTAWNAQTNGYFPYVVTNSGNWVYAGTGFRDGDSVPGMVGYEADRSIQRVPFAERGERHVHVCCRTRRSRPASSASDNPTHRSTRRRAEPGCSEPERLAGAGRWTTSTERTRSTHASSRRPRTFSTGLSTRGTLRHRFAIEPDSVSGRLDELQRHDQPDWRLHGSGHLGVSGLPTGANGSFSRKPGD